MYLTFIIWSFDLLVPTGADALKSLLEPTTTLNDPQVWRKTLLSRSRPGKLTTVAVHNTLIRYAGQ